MTIHDLLEQSGLSYTRRDEIKLGWLCRNVALKAGKRNFKFVPFKTFFVMDYEKKYAPLLQQ